jgi:hypothetical protein
MDPAARRVSRGRIVVVGELAPDPAFRYGCQAMQTPFVRLNVGGVQNVCALRYQAW